MGKSFVHLRFEVPVVSFVTTLVKKFLKVISVLSKMSLVDQIRRILNAWLYGIDFFMWLG